MSRVDFDGENAESDRRNAESFAEDGRRRMDSLAQTVKELSGRTATTENVRDEILQIGRELLTQTGKDWRVAQGLSLAWLSSAAWMAGKTACSSRSSCCRSLARACIPSRTKTILPTCERPSHGAVGMAGRRQHPVDLA